MISQRNRKKTNPEALAALRGFYLPLIPSLTN
nr:MAG TPA: hypothetical protein [Bacteriophage sp.]